MNGISQEIADEMHALRAIRNTFAHTKTPITFDDDIVRQEVDALLMAQIGRYLSVRFP